MGSVEKAIKSDINDLVESNTKEYLYADIDDGDLNNIIRFIDQNLFLEEDYASIISDFSELDLYIKSINIKDDDLDYEYIIENSINLNKALSIIVSYFEFNKNNDFKNDTLNNLIYIYCVINDIDSSYEIDYDGTTYYSSIQYLLNDVSNKKVLTREEEQELFRRYKDGDKTAFDKLVEHNIKLVVSASKYFTGRGIDVADLIQEGNTGLMEAIKRFDPDKGYRFSTYAMFWIKQRMNTANKRTGRLVQIPSYIFKKIRLYESYIHDLTMKYNRDVSIKEMCDYYKLDYNMVSETLGFKREHTSLYKYVGEKEDITLEETLSSDLSVEKLYEEKSLITNIDEFLEKANLTEREREIIKYRFGFYGEPLVLEEVGKIFNITRERIRQIEAKALKTLKSTINEDKFIDYLDSRNKSLDNLKRQKETIKNSKPSKSIYNIYSEYSKSDFDFAIGLLSDNELDLLNERYGGNYKEPLDPASFDVTTSYRYYYNVLCKIKYFLENMNNSNSIISRIKEYTLTDRFKKLSEQLYFREVVILSLSLGYVDGIEHSLKDIKRSLKIKEKDLIAEYSDILDYYNEFMTNKKILKKEF